MPRTTLSRALVGVGALFALIVGVIVLGCPDRVEIRSHEFLVAHVRTSIGQRGSLNLQPSHRAEIEQVLVDVCRFCSPRRPAFLADDAPFPIQVAVRAYYGAVLDLFLGLVALVAVNLLLIFLAWAAGRSQTPPGPFATALSGFVLLAELGGALAYFLAPAPFHFLVLWSPLGLATSWGLALGTLALGRAMLQLRQPPLATYASGRAPPNSGLQQTPPSRSLGRRS